MFLFAERTSALWSIRWRTAPRAKRSAVWRIETRKPGDTHEESEGYWLRLTLCPVMVPQRIASMLSIFRCVVPVPYSSTGGGNRQAFPWPLSSAPCGADALLNPAQVTFKCPVRRHPTYRPVNAPLLVYRLFHVASINSADDLFSTLRNQTSSKPKISAPRPKVLALSSCPNQDVRSSFKLPTKQACFLSAAWCYHPFL